MTRRPLLWLAVAAAVLGAAAGVFWRRQAESAAPAGVEQLMRGAWPDGGGRTVRLAQWRGQPLVVNFWATWCPPCREEMPDLAALARRYQGRGIRFVGLGADETAAVRAYAAAHAPAYPLLAGGAESLDLAAALGNTAGAIPYTVVIDRDGRVAWRSLGRVDPAALARVLDGLAGSR